MFRASFANIYICIGAVLLLITSFQVENVKSANILGIFCSQSPSHLIVHMSVAKTLAESGHNVTVLTTLKPKVTDERIHVITVPPSEEQKLDLDKQLTTMAEKKQNFLLTMGSFLTSMKIMIESQVDALADPRFQQLYESRETKFDLVIIGWFFNDFTLGVAAKFKCPVIINWMGASMELTDSYVGNPREVAYVPNMNVGIKIGEVMNFSQRIMNFMTTAFFNVIMQILNYQMEGYYGQLFKNEIDFPTFQDMKKNVSLVFCNAHFSEGPIRPNVPAIVEIGGIQIKDKPDPLPKDIEKFLNASSENGAILFSLGSNLKSGNIKPETVQVIFKTLSSLNQNVIWKWDDLNKTPGDAKNILYKKWMPQDDILAHPNIKLFITHAGKGGVAEAQYHAVPMVALPVFGDQEGNAQKMAASGYGIELNMHEMTESELKNAILEVINNPNYSAKVRKFSQLYRDRPLTARQTVVFWSEYVIRHHGASHIQSPAVHMNYLEKSSWDVIGFLVLIIYLIYRILKLILKFIWKKVFKNLIFKNEKVKKQ